MKPQTLSLARLKKTVDRMQKLKILVVGDLMLDQFVRGSVDRISPEAPIPVVQVRQEAKFPGGAANVARNLRDFGCEVSLCGVLGKDAAGRDLLELLRGAGIGTQGLFVDSRFSTIVKMRIIARQQQLVRVDYEDPFVLTDRDNQRMVGYLKKSLADFDAVIVEDYGKGTLNQLIFDELAEKAKKLEKVVTVDPNPKNPLAFHDVTAVKPNRGEAFQSARMIDDGTPEALEAVGAYLLDRWYVEHLLVTLGEHGMQLFQRGKKPYHTPTRAKEVYDVSGAGDTAIGFFTLGLAAGMEGPEAAEIANHAAGVVVRKLGTATLTAEELVQSFEEAGDLS
jgi:D-glycero-beta-D-manno-heptose-7-phosphate kinase